MFVIRSKRKYLNSLRKQHRFTYCRWPGTLYSSAGTAASLFDKAKYLELKKGSIRGGTWQNLLNFLFAVVMNGTLHQY